MENNTVDEPQMSAINNSLSEQKIRHPEEDYEIHWPDERREESTADPIYDVAKSDKEVD